jgi:hypothetical protein
VQLFGAHGVYICGDVTGWDISKLNRTNRASLEQALELFSVRTDPMVGVGSTVGFAVVERGTVSIKVQRSIWKAGLKGGRWERGVVLVRGGDSGGREVVGWVFTLDYKCAGKGQAGGASTRCGKWWLGNDGRRFIICE